MTKEEFDDLEVLIDHYQLNEVATAIAEICFEKADHIRTSYGNGDADNWDDAGDVFENAAMEVGPL